MDPSRAQGSTSGTKRRRSDEELPQLSQQSPQQPTSLPPIRQLYLSPSTAASVDGAPGYAYQPQQYATHSGVGQVMDPGGPPQRDPGTYGSGAGAGESEVDDLEPQGPPKKKRRRQALSCTECKRRKIKCDRSQPCTPCTRRGEEANCQWHIVEPVEKYVTKAEFDELKAQFHQLKQRLETLEFSNRIGSSSSAAMPFYPMNVASTIVGEVPVSYGNPGSSSTITYPSPSILPPIGTYQPQQSMGGGPAGSSARYAKAEDSQSPRHGPATSMGLGGPSASPIMSNLLQSPRQHRVPDNYSAAGPAPAKKLPRADAQPGRAPAPRIRRPNEFHSTSGVNVGIPPPSSVDGTTPMFMDNVGSAAPAPSPTAAPTTAPTNHALPPSPYTAHSQAGQTSRRLTDPSGPSSRRDEDRDRGFVGLGMSPHHHRDR